MLQRINPLVGNILRRKGPFSALLRYGTILNVNSKATFSAAVVSTDSEVAAVKLTKAIRNGSISDIIKLLPYVPGNLVDINIMGILNCCFKSSDIVSLLNFFIDSKFYISSYTYECCIITAGRIGDIRLVSTLYEAAIRKNGKLASLLDALLHAYRVSDSHQKIISLTYQLFSEHQIITSTQYEEILRSLVLHSEYDSLCEHIVTKMKEQDKFITIPILSILLNQLNGRSSHLSILFINQTRFYKEDTNLLNLILSREMTKCSEQLNPEGKLTIYSEMARRKIHADKSEARRLKHAIEALMKTNTPFTIVNDDDDFTRLWSECWLEQHCKSNLNTVVDDFCDLIKHSERNQSVELTCLLFYITTYPITNLSLATWKKLIDLNIVISSQDMVDILEEAQITDNSDIIQGLVLYTDEVFLKHRPRLRRTEQTRVKQETDILKLINTFKSKYHLSNSFHTMYEALSIMERCMKSDLFLFMTYGMVAANPADGLRLFDDMVNKNKVKPTKELCQTINHLLEEKGDKKEKEEFEKKYKSFM